MGNKNCASCKGEQLSILSRAESFCYKLACSALSRNRSSVASDKKWHADSRRRRARIRETDLVAVPGEPFAYMEDYGCYQDRRQRVSYVSWEKSIGDKLASNALS